MLWNIIIFAVVGFVFVIVAFNIMVRLYFNRITKEMFEIVKLVKSNIENSSLKKITTNKDRFMIGQGIKYFPILKNFVLSQIANNNKICLSFFRYSGNAKNDLYETVIVNDIDYKDDLVQLGFFYINGDLLYVEKYPSQRIGHPHILQLTDFANKLLQEFNE